MKKFICIIIAFSIILTQLCYANAYKNVSYTDRSVCDEAREYLSMMQLADNIKADTFVTRGQAVESIIKAMGLYDSALSVSVDFYTNMQKTAYFAHQLGILSSPSPDEWNLEASVTLAQSAKMLVVALGYNSYINPVNPYPTGYLTLASKLDILKYVSLPDNESPLSGKDFISMLYQAMNTPVLEVAGIYGDSVRYQSGENTSLESIYLKRMGWKSGTGIITADSFGSLYPDTEFIKNSISIDGQNYINTNALNNGYVGYRVKFVTTDTAQRNSELVGMMITQDNTILSLSSSDEPTLDGTYIHYYDENIQKEQKILLSTGVVLMVNGTLSQSFTLETIDFSEGEFEFIDNDADKKYDIIKCDYSKSFIVNFVKDEMIYLKNGVLHSKSVIDLSDPDTVSYIIRDTAGNILSLSDISSEDGITVSSSDDFSYIEIIKLPPAINIIPYEMAEDKLMADGIWYTIGDTDTIFNLGESYTVRVNEKGKIFYATQEYHGCVYVMDKAQNTSGMNNSVMLKVYDIETGIKIVNAANKVSINGTSYSDKGSIYSSIPTACLINLDINSNGEFTKLTELQKYGEKAVRQYCQYASAFNDTVSAASIPFRFDENTIFFTVPENGDDNDYGVDVIFKDNNEYTTQAYEYNDETGAVKAAVITVQTDMKTNLTYKADVGLISNVSQIALSDGEATYKILLYDDGEEHIYHAGQYDDVFRECSTLGSGDVVRYIVNYSDEIVAIERITELSKALTGFNNGKNTADEQIFGQALSLDKNIITNNSKYLYHKLGVSPNTSFSNITLMEFFAHTQNSADPNSEYNDYYLFDKRTKAVKAVTVDDIITYEMAGEGASWIFVQKSYTDVQCIVIVK